MYKIGPNKFIGGGGVCGWGEKGGAFCSVCIFHNQKMHVYLIFIFKIGQPRPLFVYFHSFLITISIIQIEKIIYGVLGILT